MMKNKLLITVTMILECFLLPVPTSLTIECPGDVQEVVPTRASASTWHLYPGFKRALLLSWSSLQPLTSGSEKAAVAWLCDSTILLVSGAVWGNLHHTHTFDQHKTQAMSQGAWSEPGLQSASNKEWEVAVKGNRTCGTSPYTGSKCNPLGSWVSLGNI